MHSLIYRYVVLVLFISLSFRSSLAKSRAPISILHYKSTDRHIHIHWAARHFCMRHCLCLAQSLFGQRMAILPVKSRWEKKGERQEKWHHTKYHRHWMRLVSSMSNSTEISRLLFAARLISFNIITRLVFFAMHFSISSNIFFFFIRVCPWLLARIFHMYLRKTQRSDDKITKTKSLKWAGRKCKTKNTFISGYFDMPEDSAHLIADSKLDVISLKSALFIFNIFFKSFSCASPNRTFAKAEETANNKHNFILLLT